MEGSVRRLLRIGRIVGLVLVLLVAGLTIYVVSRQNLKFDVPYPDVHASADSAAIARGHYLVRTVAHCAACHGDPVMSEQAMARGESAVDVPLSGGQEFELPPGTFRARNITPDPETGIGAATDGAIARALRNGVGPDGRALLPFMEVQGLSDDDLVAIVSYLRAQPPVRKPVPMHTYTLLGKVVRATVLANPVGPHETPPQVAPRGATVENGRYLAESVANCWSCHTDRSMNTGALLGPRFSGSTDMGERDKIWAPPNLTPDPKTGRLTRMTEDEFVTRMHAGRAIPGSPMPWDAYRGFDDDDLRAIYRYLMTLPPVEHDTGPAVRPRT